MLKHTLVNVSGDVKAMNEHSLIHIAVLSLGLGDLYPFEKEQKIIEYRVRKPGELTSMRVDDFTNLLSTDAPAPGGGSVAALCGALSGALSSMVGALTHGKKGYEDVFGDVDEIGVEGQRLKDEFIADVDRDTEAFNDVMAAARLPKKTDEDKAARQEAMEAANKQATLVPFGVLKRSWQAAELARRIVECGNKNSVSDAGVAALTARSAAEGAYLNVRINLPGIGDEKFKTETLKEADEIRKRVIEHTEETVRLAEKTIVDGDDS